jgi:predicted small metal-binding protein
VKEFHCSDVVPNCDFKAQGRSDEEILGQVEDHARDEHGMDPVPEEVVTQVRERIREV